MRSKDVRTSTGAREGRNAGDGSLCFGDVCSEGVRIGACKGAAMVAGKSGCLDGGVGSAGSGKRGRVKQGSKRAGTVACARTPEGVSIGAISKRGRVNSVSRGSVSHGDASVRAAAGGADGCAGHELDRCLECFKPVGAGNGGADGCEGHELDGCLDWFGAGSVDGVGTGRADDAEAARMDVDTRVSGAAAAGTPSLAGAVGGASVSGVAAARTMFLVGAVGDASVSGAAAAGTPSLAGAGGYASVGGAAAARTPSLAGAVGDASVSCTSAAQTPFSAGAVGDASGKVNVAVGMGEVVAAGSGAAAADGAAQAQWAILKLNAPTALVRCRALPHASTG